MFLRNYKKSLTFLLHLQKKSNLQLHCKRVIVSCIKISFCLKCMGCPNTYNGIDYGIASSPTFHYGGLFEYM